LRERKKRGKASRKDVAQQQATAVAAASSDRETQPGEESSIATPQSQATTSTEQTLHASPRSPGNQPTFPGSFVASRSNSLATSKTKIPAQIYGGRTMSLSAVDSVMRKDLQPANVPTHPLRPSHVQTHEIPQHEFSPMNNYQSDLAYQSPDAMAHTTMHSTVPSNDTMEYPGHPSIAYMAQSLPEDVPHLDFAAHSPLSGSPTWMLPSPSTTLYSGRTRSDSSQQLRFPVLEPVVPYLANIMPLSLACDLLELFFESSSPLYMQPVSPYVLGHVFRKNSFLRQDNPRVCSPALLASMLWIGCLTSESPYLASTPTARSQVSEKLINLTIGLLKPLVHQTPVMTEQEPPMYNNAAMVHGVTMGGFGLPNQVSEENLGLDLHFGNLDDIATYVNLGVVTSASEYKAASLRWWNAAWSLAREMRLGKEIPTPPPEPFEEGSNGNTDIRNAYLDATEEHREERRRMWWLLYTMDRYVFTIGSEAIALTRLDI
jgi:hypothetical protein